MNLVILRSMVVSVSSIEPKRNRSFVQAFSVAANFAWAGLRSVAPDNLVRSAVNAHSAASVAMCGSKPSAFRRRRTEVSIVKILQSTTSYTPRSVLTNPYSFHSTSRTI